MASRPTSARKMLLYWMDAMAVLMALLHLAIVGTLAALGHITILHGAAMVACLLGFYGLFPFILRDGYDARRSPPAKLWIAGAFVAASVALLPPGAFEDIATWAEVWAFWFALTALFLPPRALVLLGAALTAVISGYTSVVTGRPWAGIAVSQAASAVLFTLALLMWRWLWWTIRDAHDSQQAKASLAVSEERLRFARDLHDLLGHSLSVITLKSELAAKLSTKDAGRAAAEMTEVHRLAGEALAEVQVAVHGYQALDLDAELTRVRDALSAAGTRCVIDVRADDLSPAARTLLAWAVREGVTNIIKHSTATRCVITIEQGVLEIRNDGVHGQVSGSGSGLRGLSERMATAGGSFTAEPAPGGEFLLRAAVPA
ncbi:sensor histidine kinase [Nonomuraea sp. NN258]|uniref:sensor histidine kinase n=1 Tax=Nonomuraea antri TaxID=2730852 RepID=UPI0015697B91|nr:histidine kinase [Nonomuraea antri]NRQ30958.1 sensor histidine kinase [Nonomuraea antri]